MARSNKPLIWLPFAAGGTIAALVLPAVMLVTLLAGLGMLPEQGLSFERMRDAIGNPFTTLVVFVVLGLPLWHAAHRLRMTLQDLGVRSRAGRWLVARLCYTAAAIATLALAYSLWPWR